MKKKIPISILLKIEEVIANYNTTGIFAYTEIGKAKEYHDLEHDIVVYAIELAHKMPYDYMLSEIERYDASCPKLNEIQFVDDIGKRCNAKHGEVIERIQHVRRIRRARTAEKEKQMHMKQTIVVNKELNMSPGKLSAQVSHASMAFLTTMIQQGTNKILINGVHQYPCYTPDGKKQLYKRDDLWKWAEEARAQGKDHFYARPVNPENPCGELVLCEPEYGYQSTIYMDKDLYEGWIGGIFTKVCLEAKNENQMNKTVEKAKEAGLIEGRDFFCIRDACLTELTPDETGTRWTCIGFRPLPDDIINPITKRLQLYKG